MILLVSNGFGGRIMNTNEKSLALIKKEGIFSRIYNALRIVFSRQKDFDAFSLNVNTQKEYNNENYFSKSDKPTPDDNSKLLEIQEKIENLGINRNNIAELTKDLDETEIKKLITLYEEQINYYDKITENCKNKIMRVKKYI